MRPHPAAQLSHNSLCDLTGGNSLATIRRAEVRDAPALAELAERTFRDAFGHANRQEDMDLHCRTFYGTQRLAWEVADSETTTLVCEHDGVLVGYGQLRWATPPACVVGVRPAEVQRLYVDRHYHGKGTAQALMAALVDSAVAGAGDVMWLGVWEHNPRAIAFYAKVGFRQVGEQVFVLGRDPQRDVVLSKTLDS